MDQIGDRRLRRSSSINVSHVWIPNPSVNVTLPSLCLCQLIEWFDPLGHSVLAYSQTLFSPLHSLDRASATTERTEIECLQIRWRIVLTARAPLPHTNKSRTWQNIRRIRTFVVLMQAISSYSWAVPKSLSIIFYWYPDPPNMQMIVTVKRGWPNRLIIGMRGPQLILRHPFEF